MENCISVPPPPHKKHVGRIKIRIKHRAFWMTEECLCLLQGFNCSIAFPLPSQKSCPSISHPFIWRDPSSTHSALYSSAHHCIHPSAHCHIVMHSLSYSNQEGPEWLSHFLFPEVGALSYCACSELWTYVSLQLTKWVGKESQDKEPGDTVSDPKCVEFLLLPFPWFAYV